MTDRALITTGAIGATVAAICCATPLLAVVLGSIGLTVWLAKADYVVIPVLFLGPALPGLGLTAATPRSPLAMRAQNKGMPGEVPLIAMPIASGAGQGGR